LRPARQRMSPRTDRIRLDLGIDDLLDIAALAHLGFKKMMPNDRGIETARFGGEDQAWVAARAVERLEIAIPELHRPAGYATARQAMIRHWWRPLEKRTA
jgi:hypothetical protein